MRGNGECELSLYPGKRRRSSSVSIANLDERDESTIFLSTKGRRESKWGLATEGDTGGFMFTERDSLKMRALSQLSGRKGEIISH